MLSADTDAGKEQEEKYEDSSVARHSEYFIRNCATLLLESQFFPAFGYAILHVLRHVEDFGPGALEAFTRPLARGIDAHLGTEVGETRGVVEGVDRAERELNVALRVDVVQGAPNNFANIL